MDKDAIRKLSGQLYDKLYAEKTQKYRDALEYILLQANYYTKPESTRLAMIAQKARDTLKEDGQEWQLSQKSE